MKRQVLLMVLAGVGASWLVSGSGSEALAGTFIRTLGGSADECLVSLDRYDHKDFVAVGYTDSYGAGREDILLTKLDLCESIEFDVCPGIQWAQVVGGEAGPTRRTG